jgi:photosystem II stability/assembly factor-like uncharacterized protein
MEKSIFVHIIILFYLLTLFSCEKETFQPSDFGIEIVEDTINIEGYEDYSSVCFFNKNIGMVLNLGNLYITSNGAETWDLVGQGILEPLGSIEFFDSNTIYAAKSAIYKSSNRGKDWSILGFENTVGTFFDINFINPDTGFICKGHKIFKTYNSGIDWIEVFPIHPDLTLSGYQVIRELVFPEKDSIGFACGGANYDDFSSEGTLLKTINYGDTWRKISLNVGEITQMYFWSNQKGILSTIRKESYMTNDSGETWQLVNSQCPSIAPVIHYFNETKGIMFVLKDIYITVNSGKSWEKIYRTTKNMSGKSSYDSKHCIVVGENQQLLWISEK